METQSFLSIIEKYKVIYLDSYGVVKNYNGVIPNVKKTIDFIRREGKILRILTNDASRSPQRLSKRYEEQGLPGIEPEEIITSGMMAKQFLTYKVNTGKVAYLGTKQASEYILEAELDCIAVDKINSSDVDEITALVFLDDEGFDWKKGINNTVNLLRRKNIPVIVANSDKIYPVSKTNVALATGGIARLVEVILKRKFVRFGKPDTQMFNHGFEDINKAGTFDRNDILMVGDTLHTDILGGNKFGIDTALVFTGNTSAENASLAIRSSGIIPDYICESIVS